jgi:2-polyprenyl-6-methoxyphenol hydroxylase-like FAD-dependent oxidoreductase
MSLREMPSTPQEQRILIAGAGVVGLSIAQGLRQHGIPFTIFDRDPSRTYRSQGWALTLHWSLRSLRRLLGPDLAREIPNVRFHRQC